jgi:hypothetical protein
MQFLAQRLHPARGEVAAGVAELLGVVAHQAIGLIVVAARSVPGTLMPENALFVMEDTFLAVI